MDDVPPDALDGDAAPAAEDLLSALEIIEDQPLGRRAEGYSALHDELARRLDAGSAPRTAGP